MKALYVASAGGHLAHLLALNKLWKTQDRTWATFKLPEVKAALEDEKVDWVYFPTTRNIPNAIRNAKLAWTVLKREKPDVIVSSGAAVAVPFFAIAKVLGIKTVFIECYDRITMPTMSGRICYPMSDLFVVQWEAQQKAFPESVNIGAFM